MSVSLAIPMCLITLIMGVSLLSSSSAFEIYVAPDGRDENSGVSSSEPVGSLKKAISIAQQRTIEGEDVTVNYLPGEYGSQVLQVDWVPSGHAKLIIQAIEAGHVEQSEMSESVVFNGEGEDRTWLLVNSQAGVPTNLTVRGFIVRNYRAAIQFKGTGFDDVWSTSHNVVERNIFENIGQFEKDVKPSFSAVGLTNSSYNVIRDNLFRNIRNLESCDGLHSLYLAGGSSYNEIRRNTFDGGCGDVIKLRDRSNYNTIEQNTFLNQEGKALLVDSFCDRRKSTKCIGSKQECPSWGNKFTSNKVDTASLRAVKSLTRTVGASNIPACDVKERKRIIEE